MGASLIWRETIGVLFPPNERHEYDREVAAARQSLGEEKFSKAKAAGRDLTVDQAIEVALERD